MSVGALRDRPLMFWAVVAVAVIVAVQAVLLFFDVVVDEPLEDVGPIYLGGVLFGVLFVLFWGAVLTLIVVGATALRRRRQAR